MSAASVSVVVPVFDGAATLPELLDRLEAVLSARGAPFEVVLVDDGSRDRSWEVVRAQCARRPWLSGVRLMRNYGQHSALLCGIRRARHEVIATLDDDLQHPPEELPRLLAALEEGHDVVYGTPSRERHGLLRALASRLTKLALSSAMGAETARKVSALRVFRRELRDSFAGYRGQFVSIDVLLTWGSTRFAAVPVRHEPRAGGDSGYTVPKLATHALDMLTGFSAFPLQVASLVGFALTFFGALVLAYVLARTLLQGSTVPGFPFLASVIAIFSGGQLFALGIIGEYLARLHFRAMGRPAYSVRTTTSGPA